MIALMKGEFRMAAANIEHRLRVKVRRIALIVPVAVALIGPAISAQAATSGSKAPAAAEKLTSIMHAPGKAPVGTDCTKAKLFGMRASTIRARIFCSKTAGNGIGIWGYQFKSRPAYQAGVAHMNHYTGFSRMRHLSTSCPPKNGKAAGLVGWYSFTNHKYKQRRGQFLECFRDGKKPLLIWTMPTQNVFFIAKSGAKGATLKTLLHWWARLSYG